MKVKILWLCFQDRRSSEIIINIGIDVFSCWDIQYLHLRAPWHRWHWPWCSDTSLGKEQPCEKIMIIDLNIVWLLSSKLIMIMIVVFYKTTIAVFGDCERGIFLYGQSLASAGTIIMMTRITCNLPWWSCASCICICICNLPWWSYASCTTSSQLGDSCPQTRGTRKQLWGL